MRKALVIAGIFTLAAVLTPAAAVAQGKSGKSGKSGMHASGSASVNGNADGMRSLARADKVAGKHGVKGRTVARTRGANSTGFCPPGQQKKAGSGSRFAC